LLSHQGFFTVSSLKEIFEAAVECPVTEADLSAWVANFKRELAMGDYSALIRFLSIDHMLQTQTSAQTNQPNYILTSSASIYDNPEIICRDAFIDDLLKLLSSGHKRIQITGMGGLGKTEVLKKVYAKLANAKEKSKFDHIAYLQFNGEIPDDIEAQIDYPNPYKELKGINASNYWLHEICSNHSVLLCIDDIRLSAELVKAEHSCIKYLNSLGATVLLASRVVFPSFEVKPLELLPTDACIEIFKKTYGRSISNQNDLEILKSIIENRAGNHTLVVSRLGSMTSDCGWSVPSLSKELNEQNFNIASAVTDETAFQNEINKLYSVDEKLTESEKIILAAFSIFPSIPLPYELCVNWLHEDAKVDSNKCALTLTKLSKKSWLTRQYGSDEQTPSCYMHPIVKAAVQSQLCEEKPTLPHMIDHITSAVFKLVDSYELSRASELIPFASSTILAVAFEVEAYFALSCVIADYYYKTANYKAAEAWQRFTLANLIKEMGLEHPFVAMTENNLASALHVQGNLKLSLDLYIKSLDVFEKQPEKDTKTISTIRSNIATLYSELDELDLSLKWYLKSLSLMMQVSDADKQDIAETYSNIAGIYRRKGNKDLSREYFEKADLIYKELNLADRPTAANHYNNFAFLYIAEGKDDEALGLFLKALGIREKILGVNHPETASTYNNISALYEKKGEFDIALSYVIKAQKVCENVYGRMNVHTATTYNNIGRIHRKLREYQLALDWHQNAIEIYEKVAAYDKTNLGVLYSNLADVYFDQKHYELAQGWYEKARTTLKNSAYPNDQFVKYVEDRMTEVAMNIANM